MVPVLDPLLSLRGSTCKNFNARLYEGHVLASGEWVGLAQADPHAPPR